TTQTDIAIDLGAAGDGMARIEKQGLFVTVEDDKALFEEPGFTSPFKDLGRTFDFAGDNPVVVRAVHKPNDRMPKEILYIPALLLLLVVIFLQRRRQTQPAF
ncbi:MAG: DUF3394 domain-containing protein, partial [Hyphomicrobiaceae bacterium]